MLQPVNLSVFVDESGTIAKGECLKKDYFVIAMLTTNKSEFVKHVFKNSRMKVIKRHPELLESLRAKKEIKGSELTEVQKRPIYEKLIEKCSEDFELGIIMLNNKTSMPRFRATSSRAFNYLMLRYLKCSFSKYSKYKNVHIMNFIIDERNVATGLKHTLQEYLNTELNLLNEISENDFSVTYMDSKCSILLQLADFIANTFYRANQKNDENAIKNTELLRDVLCNKKLFRFPI